MNRNAALISVLLLCVVSIGIAMTVSDSEYTDADGTDNYLKFTFSDNGKFWIKNMGGNSPDCVYTYNPNGGTWSNVPVSEAFGVSVEAGDTVYVKGVNNSGFSKYISSTYSKFEFTVNNGGTVAVSGSVMSLIDGGAGNTSSVPCTNCFHSLFQNCTSLGSISSDLLPATTLKSNCYNRMFEGCTSLTSIPSGLLPATNTDNSCYYRMFYGCTSLTSVPSDLLPATTLKSNCYSSMFYGCTSLTSVPLLPATKLDIRCYDSMFSGCTSLTSIPSGLLPATELAIECYCNMFSGCTSLTSIPSGLLPATELASACYYDMFFNCSALTSVPSDLLPATELASNCYQSMFFGCTSLTSVPLLPATELTSNCYQDMFSGCTSLTSIPSGMLPATKLINGCYCNMFYRCSALTSIPSDLLPATELDKNCYSMMFYGCTSLTSIPDLPAAKLADNCYSFMFSGCTSLKEVCIPNVIAPSSGKECYYYMFSSCKNLNKVTCYCDISKYGSGNWLSGIASDGNFYAPTETLAEKLKPAGWNVNTATLNPGMKLSTLSEEWTEHENGVYTRSIEFDTQWDAIFDFPILSRSGYECTWKPTPASGVLVRDCPECEVVWVPETYAIVYKDKNGEDFSGVLADDTPTEHIFDQDTELKNAVKSGYTFGGWYLSTDCSGTAVKTIEANAYPEDVTLYAKWSMKYNPPSPPKPTYDVIIKPVGKGTVIYTPSSPSPGNRVDMTPVPDDGYVFAEWRTDGPDVRITDNCFVMPNRSVTVTAVFKHTDIDIEVQNGSIHIPAEVAEEHGYGGASDFVLTIARTQSDLPRIPKDACVYEVVLEYRGVPVIQHIEGIVLSLDCAEKDGAKKVFFATEDARTVDTNAAYDEENNRFVMDFIESGLYFISEDPMQANGDDMTIWIIVILAVVAAIPIVCSSLLWYNGRK